MNKLLSAAVAAAIGATVYSGSAFPAASTTKAETGGALDEIVVTAEKRESTVQATPISISAFSGDAFASLGLKSVDDLIGNVPGLSARTAGPGQTEYEMRGLASGGGSAATVGFYVDETPLSSNAVALNGRTVIDADLFDLNHTEVLRGPQGTLYGAGSMGGTIKLVTNPPKLGAFEGDTAVDISHTSGGSMNGGGNFMLNIPLGESVALRVVGTGKYQSGWIDRKVVGYAGDSATALANGGPNTSSGTYYPVATTLNDIAGSTATVPVSINPNAPPSYFLNRGNVAAAPVLKDITGSNLERFVAARAALLWKASDSLSFTLNWMYQKINADGYANFQDPPAQQAIFQPYDQPEPYGDVFNMESLKIVYDMGWGELTSASAYWRRDVHQSTDSTEALQNIFNMVYQSPALPAFVQNLYQDEDITTQWSQELRLASKGDGDISWVIGAYATDLHSGYRTYNQEAAIANTIGCDSVNPAFGVFPGPVSGTCAPGNAAFNINNGGAAANPKGIIFNDNNPNITTQQAIFGELSYKFTPELKLTGGLRFYKFDVSNLSYQTGVGTGTGNADPQCAFIPGTNNLTGPKLDGGDGSPCVPPTASGKGSGVLPKINLSYTPSADLTLYSTISKGYRPGGVNLPIPISLFSFYYCGPGSGNSYVSTEPYYYGPDNIWSVEIGEKARFADRRFSLNADVFYVKWTDIQQLVVLSCGYPYNANVGNAKTYGPEVEMSAKLTDEFTVDMTGAYTQAYISEPLSRAGLPIAPGTRINNIPRYTGSLAFSYETPLQGDYMLRARLSEAYIGPSDDVAVNRETLGGYGLVDARAGITHNRWSAYLYGDNLNNKHAGLTIDNTVFAWQQPTITRVSTNRPRTIGLQFETKF
jgi:iron complex outermembrane receptor protein